jgi:hypothetical protein
MEERYVHTFRPLTLREQNSLKYHRNILNSGKYLDHGNGDLTTFYGTVVPVSDDPNDKRHQVLPSYGQDAKGKYRILNSNQEIFANAKRSGLEFPVYPTVEHALKAEDYVHKFMEKDAQKFNDARRKPMSQLLGMPWERKK